MESFAERCEKAIRSWPQWSRAEQRHIEEIVESLLECARSGQGNKFERAWCARFLPKA